MSLPVAAEFAGALRHIGPSEADVVEMLKVNITTTRQVDEILIYFSIIHYN